MKLLPSSGLEEVADDDLPVPSVQVVQKLNQLATAKLAEIVRKASTEAPGWDGYDPAEVIAARALLNEDGAAITR